MTDHTPELPGDTGDEALIEALRARLRDAASSPPPGLVGRLEANTIRVLRARRGSREVRVVIGAVVFSILAANGDLATILVAAGVALCYVALMMNPRLNRDDA